MKIAYTPRLNKPATSQNTNKGENMNDSYRKLIDEAPERFEKIAYLWDWSLNHEYPTPASLFLDLIGYTLDEYGELLCGNMKQTIGGLGTREISLIGLAMDEYATRPTDATVFIEALLEAERDES